MSQQISSTMKTTDTVGVVQPEQLREIYDHFTESVRDLGNKAKGHAGSKKLGNSFMHWIGGGHIRTDRDRLCEEFLEQVQGFLGEFDTGLQGLAPEEAAALCGQVADIMLDPIPSKSNATTDLMKRAMRSQFKPFLKYLTPEQLRTASEQIQEGYRLRDLLPVEREMVKEIEGILSGQ